MSKAISKLLVVSLVVIVIAGVAAYSLLSQTASQGSEKTSPIAEKIRLSGAGATFVQYFMQRAAYEYAKITNVEVDYASIGSGGGIKQFLEKTVDFGASDAPLPRDKWLQAGDALHVPVVIGAVVPAYNLPEYPRSGLNFTNDVMADIFLGKITQWNDPRLVKHNPVLANINKPIIVVHRSDGSGTTFVWTDFLSTVSQEWATKVGRSTSVNWPVGIGGQGNAGVAGQIKNNPYSIGYLEFTYAIENKIPYGNLVNPSTGEFVSPSIRTIANTVSYVTVSLPKGNEDWSDVSIIRSFFKLSETNKNLKEAFPVVSFTYVLIYKELSKVPGMNKEKAQALVKFLKWLVTDGQQYAEPLHYIPLPKAAIDLNLETLKLVEYQGTPLFSNINIYLQVIQINRID